MRPPGTDEKNFRKASAFDPRAGSTCPPAPRGSAKRVTMPFGAGPRLCPGRYLAMLEMKMVMAMLLANFDIQSVTAPDGGEAQESLSMTMAPVGLRLRLATAS